MGRVVYQDNSGMNIIFVAEYVLTGIYQTLPVTKSPYELVVEGLRPSDQTLPVTKSPYELVVEGLRPSDQTLPVTKSPYELRL